jgi:ketosteroid isomerase-like protein
MRSRSRRPIWLLCATLVGTACMSQAPDVREVFDRYLAASNAHDLGTLQAMTADDVVWRLGPYTLQGRESAMRPHYSDLVNHTTLEVRDVRVRQDTVECTIIERNDATRAHGPDSLVHYARYVFDGGLVKVKESWKRSTSLVELNQHAAPFRTWVRAVHPDALSILMDSTGTPSWTREAVDKTHELLDAWIAAGKPGGGAP